MVEDIDLINQDGQNIKARIKYIPNKGDTMIVFGKLYTVQDVIHEFKRSQPKGWVDQEYIEIHIREMD